MPYFAWHELIESYIQLSGIPYTFIHPNYFLHNLIGVYHLVRDGMLSFVKLIKRLFLMSQEKLHATLVTRRLDVSL